MASTETCAELLSVAERSYIAQGLLEDDTRLDGRSSSERRSYTVDVGAVPQSHGSCRVILSDSHHPTDILVAIRGELRPHTSHPRVPTNAGDFVAVSVASGGASSVSARHGAADDRNARISLWLARVLQSAIPPPALRLRETVNYVWSLHIEVLILCELGGGLIDAIGLGLNAALRHCRLPAVQMEKGSETAESLTLDDANLKPLELPPLPVFLEIGLLHSPAASKCIADMCIAERCSCSASFMVAIEPASRRIFAVETAFCSASFLPSSLSELLSFAFAQASRVRRLYKA